MRRKTFSARWLSARWLFVSLLAVVVLTACERPVPREEAPATSEVDALPTTDAVVVPTVPPAADETAAAYPAPTTDETTAGETPAPAATEPAAEPTAAPAATAVPTLAAGEEIIHTVKAGETLGAIAQLYDVSVAKIAADNDLANLDTLEVGQQLVIKGGDAGPTVDESGEQIHIVQAGENLFRIGLRYGFTAEELAAYNNIPDPTRIDVGQVIRIPPQ